MPNGASQRSAYHPHDQSGHGMPPSGPAEGPLSFLGLTIRRSFYVGRIYLIYGMAVSVLLGISLGATGGAAFSAAFPLLLPVFTVIGSMGGLMVFTNDRLKGVLEYLMAYGVPPRRLFVNVLLASLAIVTVLLAVALAVGLGFHVARGNGIPGNLVEGLVLYTVPMSFSTVAFATTVGIYWTAISSPRAGLTSPAGIAPFIGILPPVATLASLVVIGVTEGTVTSSQFLIVYGLAIGLTTITVVLLLGLSGRLLRRERLLSPT